MWMILTLCSALLLGCYDVAKKYALKRNSVLYVLLVATFLTAVFLSPFLTGGTLNDHLALLVKAVLVTSSWVTGLVAIKRLPLTTASTIKASRPVFVVIFSIIIFGERLTLLQWAGVVMVIASLWLLSRTSSREGIAFSRNAGIAWMAVSVITGAASALYDKHLLNQMQPLFVQSWSNIYITLLLGICVLVKAFADGPQRREHFQWDWTILLIALLITAADYLYFVALHSEGALLSVISLVRRSSVIVTFALGAILFKENRIADKALDLAILLCGITLLLVASA